MTPSWRDLDVLARTVWGEARGESEQGRVAVAHVALNRARIAAAGKRRKLFGDGTVAGACLAAKQFSCWNPGAPCAPGLLGRAATPPGGRAIIIGLSADDAGYQEALWAALSAALGKIPDPTGGSTHYHAYHVSPSWAAGHVPACAIGRHKFYNDVN